VKPKNMNFGSVKSPLHSNSIFKKDSEGNRINVQDQQDFFPKSNKKNKTKSID
jgi:hypothetical protein